MSALPLAMLGRGPIVLSMDELQLLSPRQRAVYLGELARASLEAYMRLFSEAK